MQSSTTKLSFTETIRKIHDNGGMYRFWKGSMLIGTASIPAHAFYFSVYELMKLKLGVDKEVKIN
jgi:hypothetical protein